jgi:hypothetical protein
MTKMPRGTIYYAEVTASYKSGRSSDKKKIKVNMSFVGYDFNDAKKRLKVNEDKLHTAIKSKLSGSKKNSAPKIRDISFMRAELIHESGQTMYDIDTNKVI